MIDRDQKADPATRMVPTKTISLWLVDIMGNAVWNVNE
jgi:hypothetical protein